MFVKELFGWLRRGHSSLPCGAARAEQVAKASDAEGGRRTPDSEADAVLHAFLLMYIESRMRSFWSGPY